MKRLLLLLRFSFTLDVGSFYFGSPPSAPKPETRTLVCLVQENLYLRFLDLETGRDGNSHSVNAFAPELTE